MRSVESSKARSRRRDRMTGGLRPEPAGECGIAPCSGPEHQVVFTSGGAVYVESMVGGRWCGRLWSVVVGTRAKRLWDSEAFEVRFKYAGSVDEPEEVLATGWHFLSGSELEEAPKGHHHFVVDLANKVRPIDVRVHTVVDGTPVMTRWLDITNRHDGPVALTGLAPWAGRLWRRDAPLNLGHSLRREVGWEGWFGWEPLNKGANVFRNDTDRLWDDPYFVLRNPSKGEYFFGQLAWPANYKMEFHRGKGVSFKIEPIAPKALRVLGPGETVQTPTVHLGCVKGDFDAAVHAMHDHIRRSVIPPRDPNRAFLSQYLVPGDWAICHYPGEAFNEANIMKCIDVAASAGLEVFILDGPTWVSGYGNWLVPHRVRFPRGLGPLIEYAHSKGLLFGLYFETEGGRDGDTCAVWDAGTPVGFWKESQVFRDHPEWFIRFNLDLTVPEAAMYMESELVRIIEHYGLDLYRHDSNGIVHCPPGAGGGQKPRGRARMVESDYMRYYEAFYGIFDRLRTKYPHLILQQASAGGYRLDLATVGTFHEHFTSDAGGQLNSFRRLAGLSVFLPPEILVNAFGLSRPTDMPDLDTSLRGAYALGLTPMFFTTILPQSVDEFGPEAKSRFAHFARIYKSFIRPMLCTCRVYHHAPVSEAGGVESGDWLAMEFVSRDGTRGWATVVHLRKEEGEYIFRPKGLDGKRRYTVSFDRSGAQRVLAGGRLRSEGLKIRAKPDQCSELLLFEAVTRRR